MKESNVYIDKLKTKSRPATYPARFCWPPKWVQMVPEWTISRLFRWIALLLWLGMQKTANEEEVWSTHWLWERPGVKKFFTYKEHKAMKASLHCQNEQETKRDDPDGRPMIRKCGFLMQRMRWNCRRHYFPHADIAYDEVSILMSGRSMYKKQLRFKPIGEGIQFMALAESRGGKQYLFDFELDRNDAEKDKVLQCLKRLASKLPEGSSNYRIAADNLFNSVNTCREIANIGHRIYGTIRQIGAFQTV